MTHPLVEPVAASKTDEIARATEITWSPPQHPDAITSSQMHWWHCAALQSTDRMRDGRGPTQQIDARFWIIALHVFRESILIGADAGIPGTQEAVEQLDAVLPNLATARHVVIHSRQYLAGTGSAQKSLIKANPALTVDEVANEFMHISYRRAVDQVRVGAYLFDVADTMDKIDEFRQLV